MANSVELVPATAQTVGQYWKSLQYQILEKIIPQVIFRINKLLMADVAGPFVLHKAFCHLFLCSCVYASRERRKGDLMADFNSDQRKVGNPSIVNSGRQNLFFT